MSIIQVDTVKIVHILYKRNECWYFDTIIPGISAHIPLIIIIFCTFSLTFRALIDYHHIYFGENIRRRWRRNYSLYHILQLSYVSVSTVFFLDIFFHYWDENKILQNDWKFLNSYPLNSLNNIITNVFHLHFFLNIVLWFTFAVHRKRRERELCIYVHKASQILGLQNEVSHKVIMFTASVCIDWM